MPDSVRASVVSPFAVQLVWTLPKPGGSPVTHFVIERAVVGRERAPADDDPKRFAISVRNSTAILGYRKRGDRGHDRHRDQHRNRDTAGRISASGAAPTNAGAVGAPESSLLRRDAPLPPHLRRLFALRRAAKARSALSDGLVSQTGHGGEGTEGAGRATAPPGAVSRTGAGAGAGPPPAPDAGGERAWTGWTAERRALVALGVRPSSAATRHAQDESSPGLSRPPSAGPQGADSRPQSASQRLSLSRPPSTMSSARCWTGHEPCSAEDAPAPGPQLMVEIEGAEERDPRRHPSRPGAALGAHSGACSAAHAPPPGELVWEVFARVAIEDCERLRLPQRRRLRVDGLRPLSAYRFRVHAINAAGAGHPSAPTDRIKTHGACDVALPSRRRTRTPTTMSPAQTRPPSRRRRPPSLRWGPRR